MKRKVVAVSGSMKFRDRIAEISERLQLENGYVVLGAVAHVLDRELTAQEKEILGEMHLARIDLADAVFVANVDGYIGESTAREIEYARKRGKEILWLEEM